MNLLERIFRLKGLSAFQWISAVRRVTRLAQCVPVARLSAEG